MKLCFCTQIRNCLTNFREILKEVVRIEQGITQEALNSFGDFLNCVHEAQKNHGYYSIPNVN